MPSLHTPRQRRSAEPGRRSQSPRPGEGASFSFRVDGSESVEAIRLFFASVHRLSVAEHDLESGERSMPTLPLLAPEERDEIVATMCHVMAQLQRQSGVEGQTSYRRLSPFRRGAFDLVDLAAGHAVRQADEHDSLRKVMVESLGRVLERTRDDRPSEATIKAIIKTYDQLDKRAGLNAGTTPAPPCCPTTPPTHHHPP